MKLIVDGMHAVEIDEEDLALYISRRWHVQKSPHTTYVASTNGGAMHRLIMNVTDPKIQVDHKDGNGLNNKRDNLRIATNRLNSLNNIKRREGRTTSKYIGVTKSRDRWRTRAWTKETGHICIGSYDTQELAAKAYDDYMLTNVAPELRGPLNFE